MSLTLVEIKERLKLQDEITLLEILNLSSEDIVEAFEERILARLDDEFVADLEAMDDRETEEN